MSSVRLRGNTFLVLLLRSATTKMSQKIGWGKSNDGVTRPNMFADLIHIANPHHEISDFGNFATYFSKYLNGNVPSCKYYPFEDSQFYETFRYRMKSYHDDLVQEMDTFCRTYLSFENAASMALLVSGLILAIHNDDTIRGNTRFDTGYGKVLKSNLHNQTEFILQPFLLSVWYYIVVNKTNASEGADTYMNWTTDAGPNTARTITTKIGEKYIDRFHVTTDLSASVSVSTPVPDTDEAESDSQENATDDAPVPEASEERTESEKVIVEVVEDFEGTRVKQSGKSKWIHNGTGPQIENIYGDVTFNF